MESSLSSASEDVLGLILKRLDVNSAINLLTSSKRTSKKMVKYMYHRIWFDYNDLKKGKCKKENYVHIRKIKNITNLDYLKDFKNVKKIKFKSEIYYLIILSSKIDVSSFSDLKKWATTHNISIDHAIDHATNDDDIHIDIYLSKIGLILGILQNVLDNKKIEDWILEKIKTNQT